MAMSMSSVTVVLSSLLLQLYRRPSIHSDGSFEHSSSPLNTLMEESPHGSTDNLFDPPSVTPKSLKSRILQTLSSLREPNYEKLRDEQV
jgi:hypothetical protein